MPTLLSSSPQVEVQAIARSFLPDADYADAFQASAIRRWPAHDWAERSLGTGAAPLDRMFGTAVWHGILGFDLAQADEPGTLAGWTISVDEPDLFVLAVDGRLMAGRIVFEVSDNAAIWTTLLRLHRPTAKPVWSVAQHVHRALAGRLLARAARLLAS